MIWIYGPCGLRPVPVYCLCLCRWVGTVGGTAGGIFSEGGVVYIDSQSQECRRQQQANILLIRSNRG